MTNTFVPRLQDSQDVDLNFFTGSGSNGIFTFTHKDTSNAVVNITGWTIVVFGKKPLDSDTDVFTAITGTVTDGTNGVFTVDFTSLILTLELRDLHMIFRRTDGANNNIFAVVRLDVNLIGTTST